MKYRICQSSKGRFKIQFRFLGLWWDRRETLYRSSEAETYSVRYYRRRECAEEALRELQNPVEIERETWEPLHD